MPLPFPTGLVVKEREKTFWIFSGSIPQPGVGHFNHHCVSFFAGIDRNDPGAA